MFDIRNLSMLGYAQGFTLWVYRAEHTHLDHVIAEGYFNPAITMLKSGDHMHVKSSNGGALRSINIQHDDVVLECML